MASTAWPAPAKLNRFLHVVGRRADGYHLLQTLFQFIDLTDSLDFEPTDDGHVVREGGLSSVAAHADLVVRAARLLQSETGSRQGARIRLHKRIPAGGGLGGGSSDAATVLVALNRLWGAGLDQAALAELGLRLGADVPVFIGGRAAWAEGVGERLTPVDADTPWFVVIDPGVPVSTAEVFAAPELTRHTPRIKIRARSNGAARNDCEPVVRKRYADVDAALGWLGCHGEARLTGTGGCLFAPFESEARARAVARLVPYGWRGCVARGLNRSPLLNRLECEIAEPSLDRP